MKHGMSFRIIGLILVLTILIIASSVYTQRILYNDSLRLEQSIDQIEKNTQAENWIQAENTVNQVNKIWSEVKGTWASLIDHEEIDNIDVTLSRLQILIKAKDIPSALSEAAALKKFINHIPDKERLSIRNVF